MIDFKLDASDLDDFSRDMASAAASVRDQMRTAVTEAALMVRATSKKKYLSGPRPRRLGRLSGRLVNAIGHKIEQKPGLVRAKVGVYGGNRGTVGKYGRIHEFGTRGAGGSLPDIVPRKGTYLRFKGRDGNWVFTKRVKMPPRPFLRPALADNRDAILQLVADKMFDLITKD